MTKPKKSVWVLLGEERYEGQWIKGVFSTPQKAKRARNVCSGNVIEEWLIDSSDGRVWEEGEP